mmetsp:Transcript_52728/g.133933  ORF Transcript_52728/g.133933 Transcript_52728/m.133933 type:complete len:219 (-) Transcript_52728:401-1057(-)
MQGVEDVQVAQARQQGSPVCLAEDQRRVQQGRPQHVPGVDHARVENAESVLSSLTLREAEEEVPQLLRREVHVHGDCTQGLELRLRRVRAVSAEVPRDLTGLGHRHRASGRPADGGVIETKKAVAWQGPIAGVVEGDLVVLLVPQHLVVPTLGDIGPACQAADLGLPRVHEQAILRDRAVRRIDQVQAVSARQVSFLEPHERAHCLSCRLHARGRHAA